MNLSTTIRAMPKRIWRRCRMPKRWLKPGRRWLVRVRERTAEWLRTPRHPQPGLLGVSIRQLARWANTAASAAKVALAANNSESGAAAFCGPLAFFGRVRNGGAAVRAAGRAAVGLPCGQRSGGAIVRLCSGGVAVRSFGPSVVFGPSIFLRGNSLDGRGFCGGNHSQPPHHLGFLWGRRNERVTAL